MDSLSQLALGAACGVAVMGRRTSPWKAAAWGAVAGTLPDLDVLIDHGDAIRNMVFHRSESHSLLYLSLFSLPFGVLVAFIMRQMQYWSQWWLAMWLALVTHPLLDTMTVYGTKIGLPFTDYPYAVGSIFIIDPLYTLPLLVGVLWAMLSKSTTRQRINLLGLGLSTAYLGWSVVAQAQVTQVARQTLQQQGVNSQQLLVTPTPFNTLLWRVVAVNDQQYYEGFYSLLESNTPPEQIKFSAYPRNTVLDPALAQDEATQLMRWFSQGFYRLQEANKGITITDLRMGQEPNYIFNFQVAEQTVQGISPIKPPQAIEGERGNIGCGLRWIGRRMIDATLPNWATECAMLEQSNQ